MPARRAEEKVGSARGYFNARKDMIMKSRSPRRAPLKKLPVNRTDDTELWTQELRRHCETATTMRKMLKSR